MRTMSYSGSRVKCAVADDRESLNYPFDRLERGGEVAGG